MADEPTRLLPLRGTVDLWELTPLVVSKLIALGANEISVTISEDDFMNRAENIPRVIEACREQGLRVRANPWKFCDLTGGEALSASTLHYELTGERRYLNGINRSGFHAEVSNSENRITDSPVFQFKRLQLLVAEAGTETFFYDEFKIQRDGEELPDHVSFEEFAEIAENAHKLGMRNAVCLAARTEKDIELLERITGSGLADEISFTRYYSANNYTPSPEEYLGGWVDRLNDVITASGHSVTQLGWIQGFDWTLEAAPMMVEVAEALRNHGVENIGIWGGYCVDQQPFHLPNYIGIHDAQIREVFRVGAPVGVDAL